MTAVTRLFRGMVATLVIVTSFAPLSVVNAESEGTSSVDFWGQLIELSSTDVPTTVVVRENPTGEFTDYAVEIDSGTAFGTDASNRTSMSDWITGDYLHVIGTKNENTGVVTSDVIVNSSLNPRTSRGLNGWITEIGDDSMTIQWEGQTHVVDVTSETHLVVPPVNPASLSDFQLGDRVRMRVEADTDDARIIIALRRGDDIFLKARTRGFAAQLEDMDANDDGTGTLTVTLMANAHLREDDVNNLVGVEGDVLTVTYDENTRFVRRYSGEATVDEFIEGDTLFIVGRVNDDDTISARLVKDASLWQFGVTRHHGEVLSVDTSENLITVEADRSEREGATTVVVEYDGDTVFLEHGEQVTETAVQIGDVIHVRGTAHASGGTLTIVDVEIIAIDSEVDDEPEGDADEPEETQDDSDLLVSDIELSQTNLLEITLANEGGDDVDGSVSVYIWLDGELQWTYSSSTLEDQEFLEADGTSVISPDTISADTEVMVCIDYEDEVDETDEDNNCKTVMLEVEEDGDNQ